MTRKSRLNPIPSSFDAVSKLGGNGKTGVYVPDGWGTNWYASLAAAKAGTGLAKVGVRGDSISYGWWVSNPVTKSYPGLLATSLQALYGDGGSGFDGTLRSGVAQTAYTANSNVVTAWNNTTGAHWTLTGTWALSAGQGPASSALYTFSSGATATRSFRGTTLKIYTGASGSSSYSGFTYAIDGGAAVNVDDTTTGGNIIRVTTVTGLSAGTHTVVITRTSSSVQLFLYGIEGNNTSGVRVDNFSRPGGTGWGDYPASATGGYSTRAAGMWAGGSQNPTDLLVFSLGVNESNQVSPTGVTLSAAVAANATSLTMSGYLPPGTYRIGTDTIRIQSVTGTAAPYTATTGTTAPLQAHSSGDAINYPTVTVDSWLYNAAQAFADLREANPNAEILIVLQHVGQYNVLNTYHHIAREARALAEEFGAALINMWAIGRNSSAYWESLGYWGNATTTTPGISGTGSSNAVHISDAGAQKIHDTILPLLKGQRVA